MFSNSDVGFFLRDDVWVLVNNEKNKMTTQDFINLEQFQPINIKQNIKYKFSFLNQKSIHGLGWSQDYQERGIWSEGNISTILFKYRSATNKKNYINIKISSFIKKNNIH